MVDAKIDCTEGLLQKILARDEEGSQKLKDLPKFNDIWHQFDEQVSEQTQKFQGEMKMHHKDKQHKITYCSKVMRDEELLGEKRSIELIRKFQQFKKHKLREIEAEDDKQLILEEYEQQLIDAVEKLEDDLMEIEMLLQDALQSAVAQFKEMVSTIIGDMKQKTISYVTFVAEQSAIFGEKLSELAINEQQKFSDKIEAMDGDYPEDDPEFDDQLALLGDKD